MQPQTFEAWAQHHVLALPQGASLTLLGLLAEMRFTAPRLEDDGLRVSRHSKIRGPFHDDAARQKLGLPQETPELFVIECPRERGEPPFLGLPERTGISRACPDGLPIRDEGRVLNWAVAVARRLHGALRIAPSGAILQPDIESSVDLTVLSQVWLDPQAARKVVSGAMPHVDFHRGMTPLTETGIINLEVSEAYGLGTDLEADGRVDVLIGLADDIPLALKPVWQGASVISYQVRWTPLDIEDLEHEEPSLDTRIARRRAFDLVARVAALIHEAIGGHVVDDDWFLVDPSELS